MFEDLISPQEKRVTSSGDKSGPSGTSTPKTVRPRSGRTRPVGPPAKPAPQQVPTNIGGAIPTPVAITVLTTQEIGFLCYLMKYKKLYDRACPAGPGMGMSDDMLLNDVLCEMGMVIDPSDRQTILSVFPTL